MRAPRGLISVQQVGPGVGGGIHTRSHAPWSARATGQNFAVRRNDRLRLKQTQSGFVDWRCPVLSTTMLRPKRPVLCRRHRRPDHAHRAIQRVESRLRDFYVERRFTNVIESTLTGGGLTNYTGKGINSPPDGRVSFTDMLAAPPLDSRREPE